MHRIDADGHVGNQFDEGDPSEPRLPTQVDVPWLNSIQEELMTFLTDAAITPIKGTWNQVRAAMTALYVTKATSQTISAIKTFTADMIISAAKLAVTAQADDDAITATSSGEGDAVVGSGGSGEGAGGRFTAGSGGVSAAVEAQGAGGSAGINSVGSSAGAGLTATGGSAGGKGAVLTGGSGGGVGARMACGDGTTDSSAAEVVGNLSLVGTDPDPTDVLARGELSKLMIPRAIATVTLTDPGGGSASTPTVHFAQNVQGGISLTAAGVLTIDFGFTITNCGCLVKTHTSGWQTQETFNSTTLQLAFAPAGASPAFNSNRAAVNGLKLTVFIFGS